jgi:hypothetical protein
MVNARVMSALPLKADIRQRCLHVRNVPEADIDTSQIPLPFDLHELLTTANKLALSSSEAPEIVAVAPRSERTKAGDRSTIGCMVAARPRLAAK